MELPTLPTQICASVPFDHAKADVILRSADGVEFRVFRLFLSLASPFFETLFDLPQAPDGASDQEMKDGLAVIAVPEDSKTLDTFLRFCYPSTLAEDPSLDNLTEVLSVLAAAKKYSLDLIERKVCQALANPKVLETDPLRSFAIARNARLKHETITAARYNLRQPLIPALFAEINLITASDLLALLTYHKKCIISVQNLMKNLQWMTDHYRNTNGCSWVFSNSSYNGNYCRCGQGTDKSFFPWGSTPVIWWTTYMQEVCELLQDSPSGNTVRTAADRTIQKVRSSTNCVVCPGRVKEGMTEFSNLLALKVEEAVALIELKMDF
ncbi:uncharacterized protein F5891DRAFT_340807 [Suillus fuscotomentosus]|uniref:BTB domain-containing protein n=1 Tax=Suillus fuscotomentosus TaxID=1912939 RepID=A0AAD4E7Z0_9AGAM|nr:uncharacterized protein F5891DRAFT_340807 [Suillus fuscotomentosus]KAG1900109.1 hypothetical protein F5891DRAFT_340807 [Suillus fuscotomentosus]